MPRTTITSLSAAILLAVSMPFAASAVDAEDEPGAAAAAFDRLKKLEGEWRGTSSSGAQVEVSYTLTGNGTALVENYAMTEHPAMSTVYHLDGESILLTHYCVGNQPRMRASDFDGGELRFEFVDVSGIDSADEGHMHHAVISYDGGDTMRSAWTYRENGADAFVEAVTIERVARQAAHR